jgi:hypothetical protein
MRPTVEQIVADMIDAMRQRFIEAKPTTVDIEGAGAGVVFDVVLSACGLRELLVEQIAEQRRLADVNSRLSQENVKLRAENALGLSPAARETMRIQMREMSDALEGANGQIERQQRRIREHAAERLRWLEQIDDRDDQIERLLEPTVSVEAVNFEPGAITVRGPEPQTGWIDEMQGMGVEWHTATNTVVVHTGKLDVTDVALRISALVLGPAMRDDRG